MAKQIGSGGLVAAGLGWGLALGVVLGAAVLAPAIPGGPDVFNGAFRSDVDHSAQPAEETEQTKEHSEAQQRLDAAEDLLSRESVSIVSGALTDVPVAIVRTSAATDEDVASVRWLLNAAGASDAGELQLTEKFTDQNAADELSTVIAATLPSGAQLSVDNRSPGTHAGQSLASIMLVDPATNEAPAQASDRALVMDTLQQSGFVEHKGSVVPAKAVVVVDGAPDAAGGEFGAKLLREFAEALGDAGTTVLASQEVAPSELRGVATVGAVDNETGRISTVLAVAE